jgi:hypothetical protein
VDGATCSTAQIGSILEQQATSTDAPEDLLRHGLVATLDEPTARLVPAAEVEPEGHPRTITDDPVVELEAQFDPPFGGPAATGIEVPVAGIEHHGVVRSIELEIRGSHALQLVGLLPDDLGHVGEEVFEGPVVGRRALGIPEVCEETGAWEGDLQHPMGAPARVGELLGAQGTTAAQLPDHGQLWTLDR